MFDCLALSHAHRCTALPTLTLIAFALSMAPTAPTLLAAMPAQDPDTPVLAPLGVPTRNVGTPSSDGSPPRELPASFRVRVALPSFVGPEVKLDLVSLGPGGEPIDGPGAVAGFPEEIPPTAFLGDDGLVLRRLSLDPTEEGSHWYESEVVVAIADLRAARGFTRTPAEDAASVPGACVRCDRAVLGIPADAREILSGDTIRARYPSELMARLAPVYGEAALRGGEPSLRSVRWEVAPSLRQEPARNASGGSGDVVPGTLLHSGELTYGTVDLAVGGRSAGGIGFAFARSYRSQTVGSGPLGPGWDFAYHLRLRALPDGKVELYDGSGRRETFTRQGDESLKSPAGVFAELFETPQGYVLVDPEHTTVRFDAWGRLESIADAVKDRETTGNEVRFQYDRASHLTRVVDELGRAYDLAYDEAGRITSVSDFDHRTVRYEYDDEGRLARVTSPEITVGESTFPDGLTTEYEYAASASPSDGLAAALATRDNLVAVHDARDSALRTPFEISYTDADGDGRAEEVTEELWGGHPLSIAYDFASRTATVTDRRENPWQYQHNPAGQLLRFTDPTGAATAYVVDAEGLVTRVTAPLGRVTDMAYDTSGERRARGNVLAVSVTADSRGDNGSAHTLQTTYEYEGYANQPTLITDPRGAVMKIARNAVGLATSVTEAFGAPEAGTTATAYNAFGQPTRVTNPNGHVTNYDYFATGPQEGYFQRQTVDPDGLALTTDFDVDARGNVLAVTDARGVRHESVYNELDWLVETTQAASGATSDHDPEGLAPALGYKTLYLYDEVGQVIEERLPAGDDGSSHTRVQRDYGVLGEVLAERREVTAGAGDWIGSQRAYDGNFNLTSMTGPEGELTEQIFDERNLLDSVTRGMGTPEAATESFTYDSEGNRILFTNGRGHSHATAFDGFGRVQSATDPLGNRTAMTYDNGSNVVDSRSFDSGSRLLAASGSTFDLRARPKSSLSRLWSGSDPADARVVASSTTYDPAGNAIAITDALGRVSHQGFDAAERRVTATDPAGNRIDWALDRAGNARSSTIVEQVAGAGAISTTVVAGHDALGRPVSASDPFGNRATRTYDARGNVRLAIDPEGHFTESIYDGLDRLTRTVRPEGISADYGYDRSSHLVSYRDAKDQTTTWTYDALGRKRGATYPDATQESVQYDAAGNPTLLLDANGTSVTQGFDAANRLSGRTIVRGDEVEGPTAETFAYDGLSRLTQVQSGSHVTSHTYDSLSRRLTETTHGRTITYQHDDAGNATQQIYPSGTSLTLSFDALNRMQTVAAEAETAVSYGFRGSDLIATKNLGNGLAGGTTYDAARRPTRSTLGGAHFEPFTELLSWSPRNLKTAIQREDLNAAGYVVAYDDAGRLVEAAKTENPLALAPNNSTPAAAAVAALPDSFGFTYDAAENLLEQRPERFTISAHQSSPSDGSGRNRPGSFAGQPLAWDGNGNLIRKGPDHFAWDYRNRLTRVTRDGFGEIARYEYDAFNRLTKREAAGETQEWVWSGWQLLERYADGQLAMRRIYGQGLDEVVRQETDGDGSGGDGVLETVTIPVYDSIGNTVAITDQNGKAIERYEYAPYGTRTIRVDLTPPAVEQLREANGQLRLEFSEEILLHRVEQAIASGGLTLRDTTDDEPVAITASQPLRDGKQKGRRLLLTPDPGSPPQANHGMLLHIEPGAMVDLFENRPETAYDRPFVWLAADQVIDDTKSPRVDLVLTKAGELDLGFSEEIDPAVASASILLDGVPRTWTALPDGYTLKPAGALSATTHTLQIGPALIDKAGNPMAEPFSRNITTGAIDHIAYERPDPRVTPTSTLDNLASFQGHITDPATGLVYMRNRWMDPEMGRFLSVDPLGYVDGPSQYAFAGNSPATVRDPLGLYEADVHFLLSAFLARKAGFPEMSADLVAAADVGVDQYLGTSPTINAAAGNWATVVKYHFAIDPETRKVEPAGSVAVGSLASSRDLFQLGRALHLFQDSFSHGQAYVGNISDQTKKYGGAKERALSGLLSGVDENGIGHPDIPEIGSTFSNHNADQTWRRPDLGRLMAKATFDALVREGMRLEALEGEPSAWSSIQAEVEQFLWASTKKGKKLWAQRCLPGLKVPKEIWKDLSLEDD